MNNDLEQFSEERLMEIAELTGLYDGWVPSLDEIKALARIALAVQLVKPIAWRVGGYLSSDKKWAEKASAEENYLLEPLYDHPLITGIDENHYNPELEPGLYVAEIMTKGGAACINGRFTTPQPAHTEQDGWIKCSERLPECRGEFSVYEVLNNRVQHDYWVPDDCAALGIGFWNHYGTNVTHWMPLPAAPKPDSER